MRVLLKLILAMYHLWVSLNDKYLAIPTLCRIFPQFQVHSFFLCLLSLKFLPFYNAKGYYFLKMKVTSVKCKMCLCYAVHTEWRSSVTIIRHEGFLSNLKTCCFPSRLPNLSLLVWPSLNEKSHLMRFKDCSEYKFRIFRNSNCRLFSFPSFDLILFVYSASWSGQICSNCVVPPCRTMSRPWQGCVMTDWKVSSTSFSSLLSPLSCSARSCAACLTPGRPGGKTSLATYTYTLNSWPPA